jgi:DNA primase
MAGHIPRDFIDQLLGRIDIVDVVHSRVPLKKAGREYTACCPFHNEKTPSFTVSPTKQFFHCFGCGAHGSAISFLMEYEHLEYVEAIEALARTLGVEVPREHTGGVNKPRKKLDDSLYGLMEETAQYFRRQLSQSAKAVAYIRQRELSPEVVQQFGIGYAPDEWDALTRLFAKDYGQQKLGACGLQIENDSGRVYDRFRDRLMFPIRDRRGKVVGFGGRVLGEGTPKYLNSPETEIFHKGSELYGLFEARQQTRKLERLLVVEGYMDVVALAQFGVSYAVATLGTATTSQHIRQLFRLVPEVIFCFDGDRAGKEAAWRALENALPELRDDREIRFLFLPAGEDPDTQIRTVGKQAFESALQTDTLPLSDYLLENLKEQFNVSSREGRARLSDRAAGLLGGMPDILLKDQLLTDLSRLVGVETAVIRQRQVKTAPQQDEPPWAGEPNTASARRISDKEVRMTPVRYAIALLLNHPGLSEWSENPEQLIQYQLPGVNLLCKLVETAEENPHIHSAGLMERFRGTEHEKILLKLMKWQPQEADMQILQQEFQDCFRQIKRQARQKALEVLLHKEQTQGLNLQEKHDLLSLLDDIHGSSE